GSDPTKVQGELDLVAAVRVGRGLGAFDSVFIDVEAIKLLRWFHCYICTHDIYSVFAGCSGGPPRVGGFSRDGPGNWVMSAIVSGPMAVCAVVPLDHVRQVAQSLGDEDGAIGVSRVIAVECDLPLDLDVAFAQIFRLVHVLLEPAQKIIHLGSSMFIERRSSVGRARMRHRRSPPRRAGPRATGSKAIPGCPRRIR